jgi:hypothetical protein
MTMQQAFTVVGTVVGAYFGYPQLGFVVGSLVGAALTPAQKVEGPRIDDQKVTVSTEGAGIPRVWGTVRLGGNVIESTDKIEERNRESQGKGGGVKTTTYRYFVDMRTLLCQTPPSGLPVAIRKIWTDGKLVFDDSSGATAAAALASSENQTAALILYQGAEDQLPDPTEEARYGVGNVPAYRGVVSVVLNHIECPGGRVPQFSYELCVDGEIVVVKGEIASAEDESETYQRIGGFMQPDGTGVHYVVGTYGNPRPRLVNFSSVGAGFIRMAGSTETDYGASGPAPSDFIPVIGGPPRLLQIYVATSEDAAAGLFSVRAVDVETGAYGVIGQFIPPADTRYAYQWAAYDETSNTFYLVPGAGSTMPSFIKINGAGSIFLPKPATGFGPTTAYGGFIDMMNATGSTVTRVDSDGVVIDTMALPAVPGGTDPTVLMRSTADGVYALSIGLGGGSTAGIYKRTPAGYVLLSSDIRIPDGGLFADPRNYRSFYSSDTVAILGPSLHSDGSISYDLIRFDTVNVVPVEVADIIRDECAEAGLDPSQFDVSTITEQVHGYTITNPASARAAIQPLMAAFAIDATEEDGEIKFFNRADKTSIETIAFDELGCVEDGSEPGDPMPLTRANVTELSRSVTVSYINRDFDYQTSTEEARRQVSEATADQNVELAIAMSSDQAATAAHRILYDGHNDRNRRSMKLSRKYAAYSAGDVLTVEYPRGTLSDWRWVQVTDTGALIEVEAVPADAELYAQTAIGGTGYEGQEVAPLAAQLRQVLLDIPILRDQDNDAGIYTAIDSVAFVRAEGELFVGDDDSSLLSRGTVSASAPIGFAETVPAAWSFNLVDETNLFTVNLGDDEFSNITRDQLLSGTENVWALGAPGRWEIGKSRLGNNLGNGRYTLSSHLRGLFGTEQHTGTHLAGDTFVLLRPVGMLRPSMGVGDLGQDKSYRVVAKGRSLDSAASTVYANSGEGLRPLSPVNLRRAFASRDLQVDRRSRLSMNNSTGAVPLGESAESWQWDFFTSGAFTTLIGSATTSTAVITAAQQTAIGVTPTATAYVRVRQISDSVGLGHELQATA